MALNPDLVVQETDKRCQSKSPVAAWSVFLATALVLAWVHFASREPHHALLDIGKEIVNKVSKDEGKMERIPKVKPCHFIAGQTFGRTGNAMTIFASVLAFAK